MKTLKSIALGLALLATVCVAHATEKPAVKLSKNYAINTYVDAISRGRVEGLGDVIDEAAKFSIQRGDKVMSYGKADGVKDLNGTRNVAQDCTVSTSVVESSKTKSVVRVDMQYDGFVRSNYVTVANTADGWKITDIYSVVI
jgi:hypothetical protein